MLGVCVQPPDGLQLSSVQGLLSSQLCGGPPMQTPCWQLSCVVQALPSSHVFPFKLCLHPPCGSQASVVHALPSLQLRGGPAVQEPFEQVSLVVQGLPSLHEPVFGVWTQPDCGLHVSLVQVLPSSQFSGGPATHDPPEQVSSSVQGLPSLQIEVLGVWVQPD